MVRTIVYSLVAIVLFGTIATPGLGAFALVAVPFVGLWLVWRIALTVLTRGRSSEAVLRTRHSHLLGPGGPDDLFATRLEEDDYLAEASARASASARNGYVRGTNLPRPGFSETLSVRPRGENSIQGATGG
jgi:hypothetical protein